jgi:uncharacterized surface protein with fasciclin (FAS1) repeats
MKKLLTLLMVFGAFTALKAQTIWDVVQNSPDHETLEVAIELAGLEGALSGPGPLTLFAPTDDAFTALPPEVLSAVLADPNGLLTDILLYHVVPAAALSTDLSDGQSITTLFGDDVVVTINMDGVFINDAMVTFADITVSNGVVHVINAILIPGGNQAATVWDIIEGSYDHNTLETAVLLAGLEGALQGDGPLTVFAPTDAAFAALPSEVLDAVLADPNGLLTDILLYHVVSGAALSTDLSDGQSITTLFGEDVVVTINMDGVFINNAQVIVADLIADNGVVHVIDAVLIPEPAVTTTVWDIIVNSPDHTILETAVLAAGLEGALQGAGPLTVFAPTDAAFAALPAGLIAELLADPSGALTDILLYHVVGAQALSTDLSDGQTIPTLFGESVLVTIFGGVFINTAEVIVADLLADNGVVHVIDAVLVPTTLSVAEADVAQVSLYPNPADEMVQLQLNNVNQNASYQIVSANGAVVKNGLLMPGLNILTVNELSSGLYLINVLSDKGFSTERLMVR